MENKKARMITSTDWYSSDSVEAWDARCSVSTSDIAPCAAHPFRPMQDPMKRSIDNEQNSKREPTGGRVFLKHLSAPAKAFSVFRSEAVRAGW